MTTKNHTIYSCPVCREKLVFHERSMKCVNNHNFDFAREGYLNLLLSNQKRSSEPGDNKTMMIHRRRFFDKGYYMTLSDNINNLLKGVMLNDNNKTPTTILDSGCGEGYFLHQLNSSLIGAKEKYSLWGIDISKIAIKYAARRDRTVRWAVATAYNMPILPKSVDILTTIMAPYNHNEFYRVLKPEGHMLIVSPGPMHLFSLREIIYRNPMEHEQEMVHHTGFEISETKRVQYRQKLDNSDIIDLFVMTPYSWNASNETRSKIKTLNNLDIEIDFSLRLFQKIG